MTGPYDPPAPGQPEVEARAIFVDTMAIRATDFDLDQATLTSLVKRCKGGVRFF